MPDGSVLLLGGRSEIGLELAQRIVAGREVILAARRCDQLDAETQLLLSHGATAVHHVEFDADELASHGRLLHDVFERHGPIAVAVLAFGILGDQALAEANASHAVEIVHTDFVAQVNVLTILATLLREQGFGRMVVFSSVAGMRVRRANYVYGSAKAGLDGFTCGLSDSLHRSGVGVLLVRPGFVIGRMTTGMEPAPFSSTPGQVAKAVATALGAGRSVVWVPGVLRWVYAVARLVPQPVWRQLPR